jgi:cell division protein FtsZ
VSEASTIIQEAAHEDANIIFGAVVDPRMEGKIKITVIATGFDRPSTTAVPTPVDLHQYSAARHDSEMERIATSRVAIAGGRRSSFRSPAGTRRPPPAPTARPASTTPRRSTCRPSCVGRVRDRRGGAPGRPRPARRGPRGKLRTSMARGSSACA